MGLPIRAHHSRSGAAVLLRALLVLLATAAMASLAPPAKAERMTAMAMHGMPKLAPGYTHFPYANPDAPKGGRLTLGVQGSFDSVNPLIVKGVAAAGVRDYVIETLMTRGLDEPFTLYPLLAESIDAPEDRSEITFNINPKARFSDGRPVTADDVIFSFEVLKSRGRPNHRAYYKKVQRAERVSDHVVRFLFDGGGDREMPLILGLMPILPRHGVVAADFEQTTLQPMLGSGPYTIARIDAGRSITYRSNPDYWGHELPQLKGRFNFEEVRFEYYRDANAMLEAFKSGDIDFRYEEDPATWAEAYDFPAMTSGAVVRETFDTGVPAGMTGLAFNTRRKVFADPRVRAALIQMLDFEWINKSLFHGLYRRTESYFERSILASSGRPADARERALLAPYANAVRPDILEGRFHFPAGAASGFNRQNQRAAFELLRSADYELRGEHLLQRQTGTPLSFEILVATRSQERLLGGFVADLARIGITANVRLVDSAQYQSRLKSYDYDMIQVTWPASLSPGNEQSFRFSSEAARTEGTFNYAGVANPAVDAMIAAMLSAVGEEDFISAVRALDRVLLSGDYVIPLFHVPQQWVAHWARLKHPKTTPLFGYDLETWWSEPATGK